MDELELWQKHRHMIGSGFCRTARELQRGAYTWSYLWFIESPGVLWALHAAALRPELFATVTLHDTPHDWASVVRHTNPAGHLDSAIHGALEVYDLPDLVRLVGEEKVNYDK